VSDATDCLVYPLSLARSKHKQPSVDLRDEGIPIDRAGAAVVCGVVEEGADVVDCLLVCQLPISFPCNPCVLPHLLPLSFSGACRHVGGAQQQTALFL